ncbi:MAG: ECF-type sigma factor [Pyrinomonadaceae bacterium]
MDQTEEITSLLVSWGNGDADSFEKLVPLVEIELRRIAHAFMRRESPGHALQTTALLNEAIIKLMGGVRPDWQDRRHFFAISANIMRRILINHARDLVRQKRGGNGVRFVSLSDAEAMSDERSSELIALDDALQRLSTVDPTKSMIVELKCFGGLTAEEIAKVVGLATPTVNLYWRFAKAWLAKEVRGQLPADLVR